MAYVCGKWLDRTERAIRINLLASRIKKLRKLYELGRATEYHIDTLREDIVELKRLKRVHRAEKDVAYFTYEYLSDERNPENDSNIIRHSETGKKHAPIEEMAEIHREFFNLCDYVNHVDRSANLAIAAPRGHSKSGIFSNAFPLHQVVFRRRRYILIISETDNLSKKLVSWINRQLKYNEKLRQDFGELLNPKSNLNEKDNEEAFITYTNILVEASSSGKALRGKRHLSYRPDLVIVDDPSSSNNEGTKEAREKLINWFNSVVIPIGGESTAIIVVGTVVTATGLLNHVLNRKDFKSAHYSAIISEPDYPELWEEYCEVYARGTKEEADAFYEKHKELLEKGAKTAWEWRWTYRDLMHKKVNMPLRTFNSEYRNIAFSEDEQFFRIEDLAYYKYVSRNGKRVILYDGEEYSLEELTIAGAWDIAMGKSERSCFNSVVTVGKHEPTGYIFVLDEYSSKEPPHKFIDIIVDRIKKFRHKTFSVETINAQHEFYRQLQERCRKEGLYSTRIVDTKSHKSSKEQRIDSLEPMCHNKVLVFNENHKILLDQMTNYPHGDYVDALDALQQAVEAVAKRKTRVVTKPAWL